MAVNATVVVRADFGVLCSCGRVENRIRRLNSRPLIPCSWNSWSVVWARSGGFLCVDEFFCLVVAAETCRYSIGKRRV